MAKQHRRKFTAEYRDEVVKMVLESSRPIAHVARELGLNEGTVGNWVARYRREHGPQEDDDLNVSERAELFRLRDENRELKLKNEFLGKAAAFFAQEYR